MKTIGGLTHAWSWFDRHTAPDLANVYAFMCGNEQFHVRVDIRLVYVTSEQHVDTSNRSIATGIIADDAVNADSAKSVGDLILNSMTGKQFPITYFKERILQLPQKKIHIDSELIFQRLVTAGERTETLSELLKYELYSYPSSRFEHAANKPVQTDALWSILGEFKHKPTLPQDIKYILDGGSLLHLII